MGIMDDLVRAEANPRIEYFKNQALEYYEEMTKISNRPLNQPTPLL